jgi:hypothetical protein
LEVFIVGVIAEAGGDFSVVVVLPFVVTVLLVTDSVLITSSSGWFSSCAIASDATTANVTTNMAAQIMRHRLASSLSILQFPNVSLSNKSNQICIVLFVITKDYKTENQVTSITETKVI